MKIPIILVVLTVATLGTAYAVQQQTTIELPTYTPEQRWERASSQVTVSFVAGIAYAKSMGQSVEEYSESLSKLFAPGWGEPGSGSLSIIQGVHRNMMLWQGAQFDIMEASEVSVTARSNRPWARYFGENKMWYGVTLDEFESMFQIFNHRIAEHLGLSFEGRIEGDWLYLTFSLKK